MTAPHPKQLSYSDVELPRTSILKLMKTATNSKLLQKDAKTAVTRSTTVFISYLTATAQGIASASGQKTLSVGHMMEAIETIGFGQEWLEALQSRMAERRAETDRKRQQTVTETFVNKDEDDDDTVDEEEDPSNHPASLIEEHEEDDNTQL